MSYDGLPFKDAKARWLKSPERLRVRKACFAYYKNRCTVCGHDFRKRKTGHLQMNHTRYRDDRRWIFGREDPVKDVCPLCDKCHKKGLMDWRRVRTARETYETRERLWNGIAWPVRILIWLIRRAAKLVYVAFLPK